MAERVGFEPTVPCGTPDFESGTFDHSATSPVRKRCGRFHKRRIVADSPTSARELASAGSILIRA